MAHASEPAPRLRDLRAEVPEELATIVERMLEKDPGARPTHRRHYSPVAHSVFDGDDGVGSISNAGRECQDRWTRPPRFYLSSPASRLANPDCT